MALLAVLAPPSPAPSAAAAVLAPTVDVVPTGFNPQYINSSGVVAGSIFSAGSKPAVWTGSGIPTAYPVGTGFSGAVGFNDAGMILGSAPSSRMAVYTAGGQTLLTVPEFTPSRYTQRWFGPGESGQVTAALGWKATEPNGLRWATPTSAPQLVLAVATVMGMAPNGDILGQLDGSTFQAAVVSMSGTVTNLPGFPNSYVADSAANGNYLGSRYTSPYNSFIYHDGAVIDLPVGFSGAAVTGDGVVGGTTYAAGTSWAAIALPTGEVLKLDDLVPRGDPSLVTTFTSLQDLNDDCAMIVSGLYQKTPTTKASRSYRVQLPRCERDLSVAITERPEAGVKAGEEFRITAVIKNENRSDTMSNLTLPEGGLLGSEGVTVVDGPTWTAPSSLAPGASVPVSWTVTAANVGVQTIRVRAEANAGGVGVAAEIDTPVNITPPVDVVVQTDQTGDTAPGGEFDVFVTVKNEWDKPVADIKPASIEGPSAGSVTKTAGPLDPDGQDATAGGYDLAPGEEIRFSYKLRLEEDTFPLEITARFTGKDPETGTVFFISGRSAAPGGLKVEIDAVREGDKLVVTTKVTNETDSPIDDLGTGGVISEPISDGADGVAPDPLAGKQVRTELPETLTVGGSVEAVTELDIVGLGLAVLSENVTGKAGEEVVGGEGIISIVVDQGAISRLDAERAAADGLETAFGALSDGNDQIIRSFTSEVSAATDRPVLDPAVQRSIEEYQNLGFSPEWAEQLAVWGQERETFGARMDAGWMQFKTTLASRGSSAASSLGSVVDTLGDSEKRNALVTGIYRDGIANLGYLGDVTSMSGPDLLAVAVPANEALANRLASDVGFAWEGASQLREIERSEFLANPNATAVKGGTRYGDYLGNGTADAIVGVTGEALSAGGSKFLGWAGKGLLGEGLEAGFSSSRIPDGAGTAADGPLSDAASKLTRLEEAEVSSLGNIPKGTILELDSTFAARTGMTIADAQEFQGAVQYIRDKYDIDFIASFRTAEASSIDLAGVIGKEEWNTFKAVGAMDEAIGGPKSLRGQASVFEPEALTKDALEMLESKSPGFAQRYEERLALQGENWRSYQAGTHKMNRIIDGSARHDGIRIVNDRPAHDGHGVAYLEQLDEPEFLASRGLTPAEADDLRQELLSHPGLTERTTVVAQPRDGGVGFAQIMEDGAIRAIGSDYDLQFFGPSDGVWPPGKKGQIITEFMQRVGKNPRVPAHGASDLGFDMSSAGIKKLAEFEMLPYHPAAAAAKADQVLARMQRVAGDLRRQADRVEAAAATATPARAQALLAEAAGIRANADKIAAVTKDELIAFAKGEKLVTITAGDIRVGGEYP